MTRLIRILAVLGGTSAALALVLNIASSPFHPLKALFDIGLLAVNVVMYLSTVRP